MNQSAKRAKRKKSSEGRSRSSAAPDRTIYTGFIMIGVFIVLLAVPLTGGNYWRHVALFYLLLLVIFVNRAAWRTYFGGKMFSWQASLARLPLRFAGYGTKGGKPIEAAHDKPEVRRCLLLFIVASFVIMAVLTALLIPGIVW